MKKKQEQSTARLIQNSDGTYSVKFAACVATKDAKAFLEEFYNTFGFDTRVKITEVTTK